MTSDNFFQRLTALPTATPCLLSDQGKWTIAEVLDKASGLKYRSVTAQGNRIALCGLQPFDFIKAIVAFDGLAEAMLLLPASLDPLTQQRLIESAGCNYRMDSNQEFLINLGTPGPGLNSNYPTRWLLATSGTTGTPKLIEHTLSSLTRTVNPNKDKGSGYHWGLLYDPNRFAGLQVILQALLGGSRLTFSSGDNFSAQLKTLLDHPVNALSATPTLWRKLLMDGQIRRLNLRQITMGGEIADQSILDALHSSFPNARVIHIYASTEAGTGFAVKDVKAGFPLEWLEPGKGPIPLRIDARGHLLVKPPILPGGDVLQSRLDNDGYLDTEDLVSLQGSRVIFQGRAAGVINVGGNKVHPECIEEILRQIPGVGDAKVYPKKSSLVGQLVAADVVPTMGTDIATLRQRILDHTRRVLEGWKVPALIRFVQGLSVTSAGKIERPTS